MNGMNPWRWFMKSGKLMLGLLLTLLPMLASAQLRSSDKIVTKVPFQFVVANKPVPAGEWIVQAASGDAKVVMIRNGDAKVNLLSTISESETGTAAAAPALVFHKYGDRYFLCGMKIEGSRIVYRLPESKAEIELRAQNAPMSEEILLAYLQ
jgi:hypothetical protein